MSNCSEAAREALGPYLQLLKCLDTAALVAKYSTCFDVLPAMSSSAESPDDQDKAGRHMKNVQITHGKTSTEVELMPIEYDKPGSDARRRYKIMYLQAQIP